MLDYAPYSVIGTFNGNGVNTGTTNYRVEDNTMKTSATQPWVIPRDCTLRRMTYCAGVVVGAPDYDIDIYLNAVLNTTITVVTGDQYSIHDIDIPVVVGDLIHIISTQIAAAGNTFEDSLIELCS